MRRRHRSSVERCAGRGRRRRVGEPRSALSVLPSRSSPVRGQIVELADEAAFPTVLASEDVYLVPRGRRGSRRRDRRACAASGRRSPRRAWRASSAAVAPLRRSRRHASRARGQACGPERPTAGRFSASPPSGALPGRGALPKRHPSGARDARNTWPTLIRAAARRRCPPFSRRAVRRAAVRPADPGVCRIDFGKTGGPDRRPERQRRRETIRLTSRKEVTMRRAIYAGIPKSADALWDSARAIDRRFPERSFQPKWAPAPLLKQRERTFPPARLSARDRLALPALRQGGADRDPLRRRDWKVLDRRATPARSRRRSSRRTARS